MISFTCQSNPANPANPTKPANPARPANPTKPANPAMPANPAKAPVHPVNIPMPIILLSPITRQSMHASPPPLPLHARTTTVLCVRTFPPAPVHPCSKYVGKTIKHYGTPGSQVITQPSTDGAHSRLSSQF